MLLLTKQFPKQLGKYWRSIYGIFHLSWFHCHWFQTKLVNKISLECYKKLFLKVSLNNKRAIQSLRKFCENWDHRTIRLNDTTNVHSKTLSQLVDGTSIAAMKLLKLDTDFLINTNPRYWAESEKFKDMKRTLDNLKVINDVAERAVALATSYNQSLNHDEERYQTKVVADNQKWLKSENHMNNENVFFVCFK
jgi:hypothetical protein